LKIERLNPSISRLDLELAKAGYDPLFSFTGNHSHSEVGGSFLLVTNLSSTNLILSAHTISKLEQFSSGINGLRPYGLTYSLAGEVHDAYSFSGGTVGLTLTQPLLRNLLIDATRFQIAVARNLVKASEYQLRLQIINILTTVEQAYYELIFAR